MELFHIVIHVVCIYNACLTQVTHSLSSRLPFESKDSKISDQNVSFTKQRISSIKTYPSNDETNISSSDSLSDNKYYYFPNSYKKTTQKNPQIDLYVSPRSYTYSLTTTPTISKLKPQNSVNKYSTIAPPKVQSDPKNLYFNPSYIPSNTQIAKRIPIDSTQSERRVDESPVYYDENKDIMQENYHQMNSRNKNYPFHHNHYRDLTSMQTSSLLFGSKKKGFRPKTPIRMPIETAPAYENYPSKYPPFEGDYYPHQQNNYNLMNHEMSDNSQHDIDDSFMGDVLSQAVDYVSELNEEDLPSDFDGNSNSATKTTSWLGPGIAGLLIGILPLATIVASFIPAFISVPVISTSAFSRRKRQIFDSNEFNVSNSESFLNTVLNIMSRYEMSSLEDSGCLQEIFCTFTAEAKNNTNLVQNLIHKVVEWTPVQWAKSIGMNTLFNAIKNDKCLETYECMKRKSREIQLSYDFGQLVLSGIFVNLKYFQSFE